MYDDQAAELRNLIRESEAGIKGPNAPRLTVVSGGKGGVGTSTITANLAAVVARRGSRVLIVDADPRHGDLRAICLPETAVDEPTPIPARAGRDASLSLWPVFAGFKLLMAPWATQDQVPARAYSLAEINRFSRNLATLGDLADDIIVDAGSGVSAVARSLWAIADVALVTTTPEAVAVMDSYGVIKSMLDSPQSPRITAIVNQSPSTSVASDVFRRLDQSCQRFLGQTIAYGGAIPMDPLLANSGSAPALAVLRVAGSPAVLAMEQVVRQWKTLLGQMTIRSA